MRMEESLQRIIIIIIITITIIITTVSSHNLKSQTFKSRVSNPISEYIELCVKPW